MKINHQAAFNAVVEGLNAQKAFSVSDEPISVKRFIAANECRYRGKNNTRCGVGFLIPNRRYTKSIEGTGAGHSSVLKAISTRYLVGFDPEDRSSLTAASEFFGNLQYYLHDDLFNHTGEGEWDQQAFEIAVAEFAGEHELVNPLTKEN